MLIPHANTSIQIGIATKNIFQDKTEPTVKVSDPRSVGAGTIGDAMKNLSRLHKHFYFLQNFVLKTFVYF
jgi:hypothetical protein